MSGVVDHQSARTDLVEVRFECVATNHEVSSDVSTPLVKLTGLQSNNSMESSSLSGVIVFGWGMHHATIVPHQ